MLDAASTKQQLTRAFVRQALQTLPHGFDALDANLIHHASLVSDAYDKCVTLLHKGMLMYWPVQSFPRGCIAALSSDAQDMLSAFYVHHCRWYRVFAQAVRVTILTAMPAWCM